MSDSSVKVTVGAIVIIAAAIALIGVIWLGQYTLYGERIIITVRFADVAGLEKGDVLTVAGVHKGRVADIRLDGREALVEILLDGEIWLGEDASFTIRSKNALGEKLVAVDPGTSSVALDLSVPLRGEVQRDLLESTEDLGALAARLGDIIASLERNVLNDTVLSAFRETIVNLEAATSSISRMAADNRGDLKAAVSHMRSAAGDFGRAASDLGELVDKNEATVTNAIGRLSMVAERLDTLTAGLESGEGTLGKLLEDEGLYVSLKSTVDELHSLIEDIKKNPGRYVHVSVF
jgi:phospholipid/cholesterol/gamma-HCH transport system substrate-binding protein